jgi:hypothetical protein
MATVNLKEKLTDQLLFDTFYHFDNDKKGHITIRDLNQAMKKAGVIATDDEINDMIEEYDFSRPGQIDFDEFKSMMLADPSPAKTPYPRGLDTISNRELGVHQIADAGFGDVANSYLQP